MLSRNLVLVHNAQSGAWIFETRGGHVAAVTITGEKLRRGSMGLSQKDAIRLQPASSQGPARRLYDINETRRAELAEVVS